MGQRILAVELGADEVRAALAQRTWRTLRWIDLYQDARQPDEADLGPALGRLAGQADKPDFVIASLPAHMVAKRLLTFPFSGRGRLEKVVPFALEDHLPLPVEELAVGFTRLAHQGDNAQVLAACVRKQELRAYLDLLASAGLEPAVVTLSALALAQVVSQALAGLGNRLVIELDRGQTSLVLLDPGRVPQALRSANEAAENGGYNSLDSAGAVVALARQTLLAHGAEREASEVVLGGPEACRAEVVERIAEELGAPVRTVAELGCFDLPEGLAPKTVAFAGCLAMLLQAAGDHNHEILDFRAGEFAWRGRPATTPALYPALALGAGAALLLGLHVGLSIYASLTRLHALDRAVVAAAAPVLAGRPESAAAARAALRQRIAELRRRLKLFGENLNGPSALDVILALSQGLPPGLQIEVHDLTLQENRLSLVGSAASYTAVLDTAKTALAKTGYFYDINVTHATAGTRPGTVDFRLTASVNENPERR